MICESTFTRDDSDFWLGDQEEMGLAIRVATPLATKSEKGGIIRDSEGRTEHKQIRTNQSDWCEYSGPIAGKHGGILLMNDPRNFRKPWSIGNVPGDIEGEYKFYYGSVGLNITDEFYIYGIYNFFEVNDKPILFYKIQYPSVGFSFSPNYRVKFKVQIARVDFSLDRPFGTSDAWFRSFRTRWPVGSSRRASAATRLGGASPR